MEARDIFIDFDTFFTKEKQLAELLASGKPYFIIHLASELYGQSTDFDVSSVNMYLTKLKKQISKDYKITRTLGVVKLEKAE